MSVYRDTNTSVTFEHPFPGPLVATVFRNGELILTSASLTPTAGRYTLPLTYQETQYDGRLDVVWTGGTVVSPFVRTTSIEVITPLVSLSTLRTLFADTNWTDAELTELENSVRIFIESYTGQNFGYQVGTQYITGNGEKRIALPNHLITLTSVMGGPPGAFWISNDGWYLNSESKNYLTTKEAPPEDFMDNYVYVTKGVIVVPENYWRKFRVGTEYAITGEWGYYSVPDDVQEAAKLLANDFACGDNLYRERYLASVKYSDTQLMFRGEAFTGTGNVRADQLLDSYRRNGMVII